MLIGAGCFRDDELNSMITSRNRTGRCEIRNIEDWVYDTEIDNYLEENLSDIINIYTPESDLPKEFPSQHLDLLENILFNNWKIFNVTKEDIKRIIVAICKGIYTVDDKLFNEKVGVQGICDLNFIKRTCLVEYSWERFVSSIKYINRFHSNYINLEMLEQLFKSEGMQKTYKKEDNLELYRGRIGDEKGYKDIKDIGAPPIGRASAGRANSKGISCLYLADNIDTVYHEIRAKELDYVAVGTFKLDKTINIVDLTALDKISPYLSGFGLEWFAVNMRTLIKISNEIAKPLNRYQDNELEYLPAQYIADFIKSLGFDGICYKSTLDSTGLNYAIFDHRKFVCVKLENYRIQSTVFKAELHIV